MTIETPSAHVETPYKSGVEPEPGLAPLDIAKLTITPMESPKPLPDLRNLPFCAMFTDHMAIATYSPTTGWSAPEIKPYAPLTLDPASSCFQYCSNVFEGMKAYLGHDGKVRLFRPNLNMRRFERSVARLALPPIDGDAVLDLIKRLVQVEKRWIPTEPGHSLYLRPTIIGTRVALGVAASDHAVLYILASPSGPYFPRPVSLLGSSDAVRAWPGGTGAHKIGGNYAPGFVSQRSAAARGYDQVLWLFGEERRVTEAGAMNVFVVLDRAGGDGLDVWTPPLDGTILPGVTRASCLALLADPAFHATAGTPLFPAERTFTVTDLAQWAASGVLREVLCVGTAAIVAAVYRIGFESDEREGEIRVPTYPGEKNELGPVGTALRERLLAVQEGRVEYEGWGVVCA